MVERTKETIATEINVIKHQTRATVLMASIEIGKRLKEAKAIVGHGEWIPWLQDNFEYSERTAQNLMQLNDEYADSPQLETLADLQYSKAIALLALPEDERAEFVENNEVRDMTNKELTARIKELTEKTAEQENTIAAKEEALKKAEAEAGKTKSIRKDLAAALSEKNQEHNRAEKLVKELEAERAKPAEVVERVPAEMQQELDRLREMEKKAPSEEVIVFRTVFADFQINVKKLFEITDKMDDTNRAKYRKAVKAACGRVAEGMTEV